MIVIGGVYVAVEMLVALILSFGVLVFRVPVRGSLGLLAVTTMLGAIALIFARHHHTVALAFDVTAVGVRTNRVGAGPYRGPGGPQTAFALETLVDELAGRLDIDPLEIRLRNVADEGSPMIDGEPWPAIGLRECLAQVALDPLWLNRRALPPGDGVGLAAGVWPGSKDAAAAMCRVEPDGTVTVVTGMVDMTGTAGAFEAIAAEAMGLSLEAVRVVAADTAAAPLSPVSGGSTVTYSAGRAVRLAALDEVRYRVRRLGYEACAEVAAKALGCTGAAEVWPLVEELSPGRAGAGSPRRAG